MSKNQIARLAILSITFCVQIRCFHGPWPPTSSSTVDPHAYGTSRTHRALAPHVYVI